jgi:hypothetical protein
LTYQNASSRATPSNIAVGGAGVAGGVPPVAAVPVTEKRKEALFDNVLCGG